MISFHPLPKAAFIPKSIRIWLKFLPTRVAFDEKTVLFYKVFHGVVYIIKEVQVPSDVEEK